jgi:outer membrane protein assembly factor BamB
MKKAILAGAMLFLASTTYGLVLSVPVPYPTIQSAVDAAITGDIVIINPGTYTGDGNRNISISGKTITVRSVDPGNPDIVAATIIDCSNMARAFTFDSNSTLNGLTIIDGNSSLGGAINVTSLGSPVIRNCVITGNSASSRGGAISSAGSPSIINCTISNNRSDSTGGGFYFASQTSDPVTIIDCNIINNFAGSEGGGIYNYTNYPALLYIINCKIANNQAVSGGGISGSAKIGKSVIAGNIASSKGGGIYVSASTIDINNSFIVGNFAQANGGGLFNDGSTTSTGCTFAANQTAGTGGGVYIASSSGSFLGFYDIFWGNTDSGGPGSTTAQIRPYSTPWTGLIYSCIQDDNANDANIPFGGAASGNIDDDPLFVRAPNDGGDGWGVGNNDDYGNLHMTKNSPCIDTGSTIDKPKNVTDIDGQPRVMGKAIDMGADEYDKIIIVTKPKAGDVWATDSKRSIKWSISGVSAVDILFSDDNGASWQTIAASVPGANNNYLWQIPDDIDSSQCIISIQPANGDQNVICRQSDQFTVSWYPSQPDVPPDMQHKGQLPAPNLNDSNGPQLGCLKWVFQTSGPVSSQIAVTRPYWNSYGVYIGSEDGNIYALDDTGELIWSYDINTPIIGSPAVGYYDMVYAAGKDGKLYAIDDYATLRWTFDTDGPIYASPVVGYDGKIYVSSQDGTLYAIRPDGTTLWTFATRGPGLLTGDIFASPVIDKNGVVYVTGFYDPNLYALDANSGAIKWVRSFNFTDPNDPNKGHPFAPPAVGANGIIYQTLVYDPNLYAIDPCTGNLLWSTRLRPDPCYYTTTESVPCRSKIDQYLDATRNHTSITSIILGQYKITCHEGIWHGVTAQGWMNSLDSSGWSSPAVGPDGTIYVGLDDPFLRAVEPNGTIKWIKQFGLTGAFTISVTKNNLIYTASDDGYVCVLNPNGFEVSRFKGIGWLGFPAVAQDGTLFVSDANNRVWAISNSGCSPQQEVLHRPQDLSVGASLDFADFAVLANSWLQCTEPGYSPCAAAIAAYGSYTPGDIDRDYYVDLQDLMLLTDKWLSDTGPAENWNNGFRFWPHPHVTVIITPPIW